MEKYSENNLVKKSNDLVEASYKLTVNEQKIVLLFASFIKKEDEEFKPYEMMVKDLVEALGMDKESGYRELKKLTKTLLSKVLEVKIPNEKNPNELDDLQTNWFSSIRYRPREGVVEASFDPRLKPFLLKLKSRFTSYIIHNVTNLKSSYSIRLYELLKQYENIGVRIIEIKDLRNYLGLEEDKYSRFNNFRIRVLDQAYEEINNKTDIQFEYETIKIGRNVEKIKFIIKSKKVCPINETKEEKQIQIDMQTRIKIDTLKSIIHIELDEKDYISILDAAENDLAKVLSKYYLIKDKKDIKNFTGLLIEAIREDYNEISVAQETNKSKIKTNFHNLGEERFKKYSPEEFEKIAIENNKKKFKTY